MKKAATALLLALLFCQKTTAQRVVLYKNFANYVLNNRSDLTFGIRYRPNTFLTFGTENWHLRRPLFRVPSTGEELTIINHGRRFNAGVWHLYERKRAGAKWRFYDHFFGQMGYQYHESISVTTFPGASNPFIATSRAEMRLMGIGIENGFVYVRKNWFAGPAITNGYVAYFEDGVWIFPMFELSHFNKGMYLWLPTLRIVAGIRL